MADALSTKSIDASLAVDPKQLPDECAVCKEIDIYSTKNSSPKLTTRGAVILGVSGAVFAGIYAVTTPFLLPALRKICLPFVPATPQQVRNVFTALSGRTGSFMDIGSGDGRLVLEAARRGFQAEGVELNTWLVLYSRLAARRQGLHSQTAFHKKNLWKYDLSRHNNIVIFGVEIMMAPLEAKLSREVGRDTWVAACRFPFPTWEAAATVGEGVDMVWLYRPSLSGQAQVTPDCRKQGQPQSGTRPGD